MNFFLYMGQLYCTPLRVDVIINSQHAPLTHFIFEIYNYMCDFLSTSETVPQFTQDVKVEDSVSTCRKFAPMAYNVDKRESHYKQCSSFTEIATNVLVPNDLLTLSVKVDLINILRAFCALGVKVINKDIQNIFLISYLCVKDKATK